ncbi:hypothetical protein EDB80DRAFT_320741 [Ilyonectria destructans]|nr:hypothetical protein EDB80DRAFT_320741 [Ilyonectria destructans]
MVRPCHRHFWSFLELVRLQSGRASSTKPGASLYDPARSTVSGSIWLHLSMLLLFSGVQVAPSRATMLRCGAAVGRALRFPASRCSVSLSWLSWRSWLPSLDSRALTLSPQPYPSSSMLLLPPPPSPGFPALWTRHTRCVAKRPPSHWPLLKCRESGPLFSRLALGQRSLVWCYGLIRPRQRTLPS